MERLRFGVIGAGRLGGFHAQKLAANPQTELAGVADPSEDARNGIADACKTQAYADSAELLAQVDAVIVAAPTIYHHTVGLDCLRRGVHVLMEKPLAPSVREADELVRAAKDNNVVLQVGHVERYNPALATASRHLQDPFHIDAVRASGFTFRSTDIGVVLDLMIHDIDVVLSLVDSPVTRVDAMGLSLLGGHEDVANARIDFANGCFATLSASRVSHTPARRMDVWSRRAFATIDFGARRTELMCPSEALLSGQFQVDSLTPDEVEHYKQHLHDEHLPLSEHTDEAVDALCLEQADFIEAITTGSTPRVTGDDGRNAVAIADSILRAIEHNTAAATQPALRMPAVRPDDDRTEHRKAG